MSKHKSYCMICGAYCGLELDVEAGKVLSIKGDPENAQSRGYMCVKGAMSAEQHNGADRLTNALERGPDGELREVGAEAALDVIADRLGQIVEESGPGAVGVLFGTGGQGIWAGSLMRSFLEELGTPYLFSTMTIDQSAKWVTAGRLGVFATGKPVIDDLDVVLLCGNNPAQSHLGGPQTPVPSAAPMRGIREARKRGAKLIVVDPRRTETADQADLHLQIIPGEDPTLFAGMIRLLLENGWEDRAFCDRFVDSVDALRTGVEDFTLDYVSERTGIPEDQIVEATRLFATADRAAAASGTGANMAARSNLAEHLFESFNALCGGYRRAGDVIRNSGVLLQGVASQEMVVPPTRSWESGPQMRSRPAGKLFGEFPMALLPHEILEPEDGGLRALIVVGCNPVMSMADPEMTLAALDDLDLLVCVDPRLNETGERADFVLPTPLPYERHEITAIQDVFWTIPFAQYAPPVLKRPAGVIDDAEVFLGLARRMGLELTFKPPVFGMAFADIEPGLKLDMSEPFDPEKLIEWLCSLGEISFEELKKYPSGYSPEREPIVVQPAPAEATARLQVFPEDIASELAAVRQESVGDDGARYRVTSRRILHTMNGQQRKASRTLKRYPTNPAFMNPDDMSEEGIESGMAVELESDAGKVIAFVEADPRMRRGVISLTHMFGAPLEKDDPDGRRGAHAGRLVSLRRNLEPINYMPRQSGIPVQIRPRPEIARETGGTTPETSPGAKQA